MVCTCVPESSTCSNLSLSRVGGEDVCTYPTQIFPQTHVPNVNLSSDQNVARTTKNTNHYVDMLKTMRQAFACAAFVLVCFVGHCTSTPSTRKLISGEASEVQPDEHRNVVKLNLHFSGPEDGAESTCTGTLISPGAILTAAHCLHEQGYRLTDAYVVFPGNSEKFYISNLNIHPEYTGPPHMHNDIAVLGLKKCMMDTVPVTLSQSGDLTCKAGEAVGYGYTNYHGEFYGPTHKRTGKESATEVARKTTLRLHSAKTCDEIHNHLYRQALASNNQDLVHDLSNSHLSMIERILLELVVYGSSRSYPGMSKSVYLTLRDQLINYQSSEFCTTVTTESFQQINSGDSGGPIFVDGEQVGVVSGAREISRGFKGKYGKVSSHLDWINRAVQKLADMAGLGCGAFNTQPTPKRKLSLRRMPRRKLNFAKRLQQDLLQLTKGKVWSIIDLMYKKDQCPLRQEIQAN